LFKWGTDSGETKVRRKKTVLKTAGVPRGKRRPTLDKN